MPTGFPVALRRKDCDSSTKRLLLAATMHARAAPAKNSNAATERRTSRCIRPPKSALLPQLRPYGLHSFRLFQFFDHTPAAVRSRFPAPIGSEPRAVPADHRLWLEDFECVQYSRSP